MKRSSLLRSIAVTGIAMVMAGCASVRPPKPVEAGTSLVLPDTVAVAQAWKDRAALATQRGKMGVTQATCETWGRASSWCKVARRETYGEEETRAIYNAENAAVRRIWATMPPEVDRQPSSSASKAALVPVANQNTTADQNKSSSPATPASDSAPKAEPHMLNKVAGFGQRHMPTIATTAVSMGLGYTIKPVVASFVGAALATTLPASMVVVATVGAAALTGALFGGSMAVLRRHLKERQNKGVIKPPELDWDKKKKGWVLKEFARGAMWGGLGGAVGAGIGVAVADYLHPNGFLHNFFQHHAPARPAAPVPHNMAPASAPAAPHSAPTPVSHPVTHPTAPVVPVVEIKDLLTPDQMKGLPQVLQKLSSSHDAKDMLVFCKEASARLAHQHTHASYKAAAKLIQRGLDIAVQNDVHNRLVDKLQADMAYLKAWKFGPDSNVCAAYNEYAKHAGSAMHNYAGRLAHFVPKNCPVPAAG